MILSLFTEEKLKSLSANGRASCVLNCVLDKSQFIHLNELLVRI